MNASGTGADLHERLHWALLAITALVFGSVAVAIGSDPWNVGRAAWVLGGGVVAYVVLIAVVSVPLALTTPAEPNDERDAVIRHRAARLSGPILAVGVLVSAGVLVMQQLQGGSAAGLASWMNPMSVAYLLMGTFVVSETVRMAGVAIGYRRF